MKANLRKAAVLLTALAVTASIGTATALAAEADTSSYGYLTGRQQSTTRQAQFEEAASLTTDGERASFFAARGIGGDGAYSAQRHLDAAELAEAGVIDQATAEKIEAYAAEEHTGIHARYAGKSSGMTPQERRAWFESFETEETDGDSVSGLLDAGIITQEQADAINGYLTE